MTAGNLLEESPDFIE